MNGGWDEWEPLESSDLTVQLTWEVFSHTLTHTNNIAKYQEARERADTIIETYTIFVLVVVGVFGLIVVIL